MPLFRKCEIMNVRYRTPITACSLPILFYVCRCASAGILCVLSLPVLCHLASGPGCMVRECMSAWTVFLCARPDARKHQLHARRWLSRLIKPRLHLRLHAYDTQVAPIVNNTEIEPREPHAKLSLCNLSRYGHMAHPMLLLGSSLLAKLVRNR